MLIVSTTHLYAINKRYIDFFAVRLKGNIVMLKFYTGGSDKPIIYQIMAEEDIDVKKFAERLFKTITLHLAQSETPTFLEGVVGNVKKEIKEEKKEAEQRNQSA